MLGGGTQVGTLGTDIARANSLSLKERIETVTSEITAGKNLIKTAIENVNEEATISSSPTFQELADNINELSGGAVITLNNYPLEYFSGNVDKSFIQGYCNESSNPNSFIREGYLYSSTQKDGIGRLNIKNRTFSQILSGNRGSGLCYSFSKDSYITWGSTSHYWTLAYKKVDLKTNTFTELIQSSYRWDHLIGTPCSLYNIENDNKIVTLFSTLESNPGKAELLNLDTNVITNIFSGLSVGNGNYNYAYYYNNKIFNFYFYDKIKRIGYLNCETNTTTIIKEFQVVNLDTSGVHLYLKKNQILVYSVRFTNPLLVLVDLDNCSAESINLDNYNEKYFYINASYSPNSYYSPCTNCMLNGDLFQSFNTYSGSYDGENDLYLFAMPYKYIMAVPGAQYQINKEVFYKGEQIPANTPFITDASETKIIFNLDETTANIIIKAATYTN